MQSEIKEIQERIDNLSTKISSSLSRNFKEQIQHSINEMQKQVDILKKYKIIVGKIKNQWDASDDKRNLYKKYNNIIINLYLNTSNRSINKFISLFGFICSDNAANNDFPLSFLEISREFKSISSEFGSI